MAQDSFLGNTLSVRSLPGQDKLYQSTNTESIFSFGDFRITRELNSNFVFEDAQSLSFDRFQNLTSLTSSDFNAGEAIGLTENDLNLDLTDPNSYAYFSSYYSKIANTINKIIENFPYAILVYNNGIGETNYTTFFNYQLNYTDITLISSAFTNQGNIIYTSGNSINALSSNTLTLYDNFDQFELQLSSTTLNTTPSYSIKSYSYSGFADHYHLNFRVNGLLTANTTDAIYIRPSKKRYFQYKRSLGNLEYQLLEVGKFQVPNPDNDIFYDKVITWPRSIDGFAPDSYGTNFDNYLDEILRHATLTDQIKTNWLVRAIVPENYLELDSDGSIYRKLLQTYGEEFDNIKEYIDNLAFSHSINYTESETVSNKFLGRLTELLGWKQPINFTDSDFFQFLGQEDDNNKTLEDYNLDLWRRILTNINWLYKRKGTREAIMFIFKVIGAPNCLVNFNEFVYEIQKNANIQLSDQFVGGLDTNDIIYVPYPLGKVNENGYINFQESDYIFQEGGKGRGNGQIYIDQWTPEFDPKKTVDNIKVYTGSTEFFGTQNIVNSKEISIGLDPASAIECDAFDWYKLGFFVTGNTTANLDPDYKIPDSDVELIAPTGATNSITAMTISQWLSMVYNNVLDVRTRKTSPEPHHNYFYPDLRKIYLTYYFWNETGEISNRVNFVKLEQFLRFIESKLFTYIEQALPATTIFQGVSTIYRNTVFNRQKFVYKKGINDGSEFQIKVPDQFYNLINAAVVTSKVNDILKGNIIGAFVSSKLNDINYLNVAPVQVSGTLNNPLPLNINAVSVTSNLFSANTLSTTNVGFVGTVIMFPLSGIPIGTPPPIPQPYTGNTVSGGGVGPSPVFPPVT